MDSKTQRQIRLSDDALDEIFTTAVLDKIQEEVQAEDPAWNCFLEISIEFTVPQDALIDDNVLSRQLRVIATSTLCYVRDFVFNEEDDEPFHHYDKYFFRFEVAWKKIRNFRQIGLFWYYLMRNLFMIIADGSIKVHYEDFCILKDDDGEMKPKNGKRYELNIDNRDKQIMRDLLFRQFDNNLFDDAWNVIFHTIHNYEKRFEIMKSLIKDDPIWYMMKKTMLASYQTDDMCQYYSGDYAKSNIIDGNILNSVPQGCVQYFSYGFAGPKVEKGFLEEAWKRYPERNKNPFKDEVKHKTLSRGYHFQDVKLACMVYEEGRKSHPIGFLLDQFVSEFGIFIVYITADMPDELVYKDDDEQQ